MKSYQMVPVGGSREFRVRVSGKVQLAVGNSSLVTIGTAGAPTGSRLTFDSKAGPEFSFTIRSIAGAGRTQIVAARSDGSVVDRLVVSVKTERSVTYNIHRLQDIVRLTSRGFTELQTIMGKVEKYYLEQANIRLTRQRTQTLFIKQDLGDPFDDTPDLIKPIDNELSAKGFYAATLNLISTWDLKDKFLGMPLQGSTPFLLQTFRPQVVLVKAQQNDEETNTYAHEIGHGLGLQHQDQPHNFLMNDQGNLGYAMRAIDIDRINTSGTQPTP